MARRSSEDSLLCDTLAISSSELLRSMASVIGTSRVLQLPVRVGVSSPLTTEYGELTERLDGALEESLLALLHSSVLIYTPRGVRAV
ncbi:unnamed protein product [Rodentolepis nana]|uniref:Uncharacterized protein n=1 Tax=Rodentolepis nana TaxID=102285 RepID=A0A3P7SWS8_RODNA|nr:unnamed protein product [Rodentolepis nana]